MGFLKKFDSLFKKRKPKTQDNTEQYLRLVKREPGNAKAHLKLAEIYQKSGDKQRSISEYLLAAEIFSKNNFYARAMAIYKQVPKQDPTLDHVYLKIADIYRKMGFLGDAFAQYRILVNHYDSIGQKDKALEVMNLMAELDPRKTVLKERIKTFQYAMKVQGGEGKGAELGEGVVEPGEKKAVFFDLTAELEAGEPAELKDFKEIASLEKIYGFEEIFKELKEISGPSLVDPNFNYNMGVACREMGFIDDAIEQFQIAAAKGQSPFEAANMLGICFKEKGMWEEARHSFEKALQIKGGSQTKILEVQYELGLICKQMGKTEEALEYLRQISAVDQGYRNTKDEIVGLVGNLDFREKSLKK